jgi:hypothetical protein
MNDTKTSSTQIDWRDITDPKLRQKMQKKAYDKNYRAVNKDKIKKQRKAYYESNKPKLREQKKTYYENNKKQFKVRYETNKNKIKDQSKIYRQANKEKLREQKKTYIKNNKEKIKERRKAYNKANREKIKAWREANKDTIINYSKNRCKINLQFKLTVTLRSRLNRAIRNNQKSGSAVKDLGCTINELKAYLESKFLEGMTWDNWGLHGWHIDHIKPLSLFDLSDRDQFLQACHYTNLQPLWAKDNLSKRDKIL